ncbi:MAG: hypothetical protein K9N00_03865, partial [Candidatus Marinimicrobia bacterium]|nr:hypothetical protein [Candidatus Neomarinimicrobiota bacterium]
MRIISILLLLISHLPTSSFQPAEVFHANWGQEQVNLSYRTDPAMRFGPQSFKVEDSRIKILDPVNNSLKVFQNNRLVEKYFAPDNAKSFAIKENQNIAYLVGRDVHEYSSRELVHKYINKEKFANVKDLQVNENQLLLRNNDGTLRQLTDRSIKALDKPAPGDLRTYNVKLKSRSEADFTLQKEDTKIHCQLTQKDNNLGAVRYLGEDNHQRLYFDVDIIENEVPLKVSRQIWITDYSGQKLGRIYIPSHYYTSIHNDLELKEEGTIYHMLSSEDGIHIFKWEIPEEIKAGLEGHYPEKYQKQIHFNNFKDKSESSLKKKVETLGSVSRDKALQIADSYVQHEWTCTADNLTDGTVTAPDGYKIDTPDWIQIGENQKIPYKW